MRISRLFVNKPLTLNQSLELDDDNAHYVRTVLRLANDGKIVLFNSDGFEYGGVLGEVSRKRVSVTIQSKTERSVESPLTIHLGLGLSRGDRMDLSVQKAVELGVNRITPLSTERSIVQLSQDKKQQRYQHWSKIIQHATEQCGRTVLPTLSEAMPIQDWLAEQQQGLRIFLDPHAESTLWQLQQEISQVTLLTGPEGGFSDQERDFAISSGFAPIRLGQRILRTETAAIAALAAVQMLWGDFRL
jgi:16S rRNA (uracil1498-N3)-methyltransferase